MFSTYSRAVKGAGLKIPCFGFVGSNPTTCIKFKSVKSANSGSKIIIEVIKQVDIPYSPGG